MESEGNGRFVDVRHEGDPQITNDDSATFDLWLDGVQLWREKDSTTNYYRTKFFETEKEWSVTLAVASGFRLDDPDVTARAWTVKSSKESGPQTAEEKSSLMFQSWDDGTTSYTLTAPEGKFFRRLDLPYLA